MALKKPSELFNNEPKKKVEIPEQLEGILPENFDAYKSNVRNIEVLNDFVSSFGTLKENIQKIDNLQEVIQSIKEELQSSITKEDLDTAMMSNLLVLEKNIQKIEFNLKGINYKDLNRINEEIEDLENKVLYALEEEFPKYKKALKSNEIFIKDKFYEYSSEIDEKVNQFEEFIVSSFQVLQENLQSINEDQLIDIRENVVKSSQEVENQNQLIEKTKKQIFGIEKDVKEFYQKIQETFQSYQQSQEEKILTLEETISSFGDVEVKKYKSLLQETSNDYKKLIKSIEVKGLSDNQKFEKYQDNIADISNIIEELKENLEDIQDEYSRKKDYQRDITELKNQFTKKINLLENDISFKENKIKKVNQDLTEAIEIISNQFDDLNLEELNKKYSHLTNKISYIEEVFKKFNEKTVLNEGLLNEPPTSKNSDSLTPLDKNYVTLDQLQDHYRLFINRVQQQLSTIGGGGETRLEFLDDVDRNSAKVDGRFLKYDAATDKWVGAIGGGGGGSGESYWVSTSAGIHTLSNVGVGTTAKSDFKLFVEGNAKVTGILTVGNQSVTIDGSTNTIKVGSGVTINGNTGIVSATAIYVAGSQVSTFSGNYNDLSNKPDLSTISVAYATTATVAQGLTGTPNITVGIVTATSFVKSGGTSSQFLKADGSVDSSTYLTSYTETDTLNSVTGRGNSTVNGISVGILTATSGNFSGIITSSGAVISGVVTATSFVKSGGTSNQFLKADGSVDSSTYLTTTGSGTNLTGIVTSIVAGDNITISGSTGQVTINSTGGGGGAAALDILEVMMFA